LSIKRENFFTLKEFFWDFVEVIYTVPFFRLDRLFVKINNYEGLHQIRDLA